jgi:hypothetical protein
VHLADDLDATVADVGVSLRQQPRHLVVVDGADADRRMGRRSTSGLGRA